MVICQVRILELLLNVSSNFKTHPILTPLEYCLNVKIGCTSDKLIKYKIYL
jgi:hypothetical protein